MNKDSLGIRELNSRLQSELNPPRADEPAVERFGWQFRPQDKVIQNENDYDKDMLNATSSRLCSLARLSERSPSGLTRERSFMISGS